MTELDKALEAYLKDDKAQSGFYEMILNGNFYIPTHDEGAKSGAKEIGEKDRILPMVLEADGKPYMPIFENEARLSAWAKQPVPYVVLPGHVIVEMSTPGLHWALNLGTDHQKEFLPDEIEWLGSVVSRCKEHEQEQG